MPGVVSDYIKPKYNSPLTTGSACSSPGQLLQVLPAETLQTEDCQQDEDYSVSDTVVRAILCVIQKSWTGVHFNVCWNSWHHDIRRRETAFRDCNNKPTHSISSVCALPPRVSFIRQTGCCCVTTIVFFVPVQPCLCLFLGKAKEQTHTHTQRRRTKLHAGRLCVLSLAGRLRAFILTFCCPAWCVKRGDKRRSSRI